MNNIIHLKDFRENVAKYTKRIEEHQDSFIVMKRSKALFRITPVDEGGWETVIDFTKFRKEGIEAGELLKRLNSK